MVVAEVHGWRSDAGDDAVWYVTVERAAELPYVLTVVGRCKLRFRTAEEASGWALRVAYEFQAADEK